MTKFTPEQQAILEEKIEFDVSTDPRGFSVLGTVEGNVLGDVKGHVWGDVKGNVEGNVEGRVWGNVVGDVMGTDCH